MKQRLSKFMAAAGVASRRACETLIFEGRVEVNGEVITIPQTQVDETDKIKVDGEGISRKEEKVYLIMNKPKGYVCSTVGKRTIYDLFETIDKRLFTVGRLDRDTTGLLLLTNDGHFSNKVIHPSSNIQKEYLAKTDQEISHEHLVTIAKGTAIEDIFVKPVRVKKVRKGTVKVTVSEGRKREVRILLERCGLHVRELTRTRIGGLQLGSLQPGQWRHMTEKDKQTLFGQ